MSDKNIAWSTLAVAAVGTIVICVLAYKLNKTQGQLGDLTKDPLGSLKSLVGG